MKKIESSAMSNGVTPKKRRRQTLTLAVARNYLTAELRSCWPAAVHCLFFGSSSKMGKVRLAYEQYSSIMLYLIVLVYCRTYTWYYVYLVYIMLYSYTAVPTPGITYTWYTAIYDTWYVSPAKTVRRRIFDPFWQTANLTDAKPLGFSVEHSALHAWPMLVFPWLTWPSPDMFVTGLTPLVPHSRFGEKLLGNRLKVSPKRECGPKGVKS